MIVFGAGSTATYPNPGLPSSDGAVTVSRPDINRTILQWRFSAHAHKPDGGRSIGPDVYAAFGRGPEHSVPDHPKDLLLVKDRVVLIARTEVEI